MLVLVLVLVLVLALALALALALVLVLVLVAPLSSPVAWLGSLRLAAGPPLHTSSSIFLPFVSSKPLQLPWRPPSHEP